VFLLSSYVKKVEVPIGKAVHLNH